MNTRLLTGTTLFLALLASSAFAAEAEGVQAQNMTIIETILHGGPLIVFIWLCIVTTSVVMVTFIIQLFLSARSLSLAPKALVNALHESILAGNYQEAWETCRVNGKVYIAAVLGGALERIGRGKEATEVTLIELGIKESQALKTRNSYLSVIGVISPMIGLLGTVIGMMGAFSVLGQSGVNDMGALALRIGEVLMATASGLFIAIPAFIFYYFFRNRITAAVVYADSELNQLVEDIPFDEVRGMRIGENFSAGDGLGTGKTPGAATSHKVSMQLTTNCPLCQAVIVAGQNPCPACGTTLDWQQ
ncbi:MAG: MotA/TolQ/ExbB proton channel family protein [Chthoniobacterales bacterium]|jgi:biopolymer transport protein ExbB|nr:MotA/TolQ/ExbB proton channel family protein [Chthoniobacterales bacterium]